MAIPHVVVIGGGHNGLVCAAYLARAGARVTLLERRAVLGGAAVTEERWPGYRISRAAYVLSLFRPRIIRELALERFGLRLLPREPASFTPLPDGRSLVLGADPVANVREIRRFSERDAERFPHYEALLERLAHAVEPTLDAPPPVFFPRRLRELRPWLLLARAGLVLGKDLPRAARLLIGPARDLLLEWFDSEPLRTTLATDAIIGAWAAPSTPGTGYVLFHHVMGSVTGQRGIWAYVEGGMGKLSEALAASACAKGATIRTESEVRGIRTRGGRTNGVTLANGEEIAADAVVSAADPARTFRALDAPEELPESFLRALAGIDYRSPVIKLNLVLGVRPVFRVSDRDEVPLSGTIHMGPLDLDGIEQAFDDARAGSPSRRPVVELTIPSILDPTLADNGRLVASIFAQYAPLRSVDDPAWPHLRDEMRDRVLDVVEEVAPGFGNSIEEIELLTPADMEAIFGLTGGNIFHGAMHPHRLFFMRPFAGAESYRTPIEGLFLCGSGTHPGGGVMGASGRNAALEIRSHLHRLAHSR